MRSATLALGVAVLLTPPGLEGQSAALGLDGAWRVSEVVTAGPGARVLESPQPGLLLFTGRYYSYTLVTGEEPRPALPGGVSNAEYLLTVWNPFTANAGTFEVSDSTMTRRPIVAKNPDAMAAGAFNEYTFRLSADTLWATATRTEAGPVRGASTVRYVRVR
jgi:hypothetical protein